MEAPAAIYMLSAISTSEIFSTNSVKACTSSNDIPSYRMMRETVDNELQNGSDHIVVASYSGLYEEGDVEHINVFGLVF